MKKPHHNSFRNRVQEQTHLFTEEVKPVKMQIEFPYQQDLWGEMKVGTHVTMGYYFELLTQALFGGKLTNHVFLNPPWEEPDIIKPDIVDNGAGRIGESKAIRIGHGLNLLDEQIRKYSSIQVGSLGTKIYFAIWRHDFKGIKAYGGTEKELFDELTSRTAMGLVIPFSMVRGFWKDPEKEKEFGFRDQYVSQYQCDMKESYRREWRNRVFYSCTTIKATTLTRLCLEPETIIPELGYPLERFSIRRKIVPCGINFLDREIKPFPILIVQDLHYNDWVKRFIEERMSEVPF